MIPPYINRLGLVVILFVVSACTTFNSISVVKPSVGFAPTEVNSLQPILSWEKLEGYEGNYDLILMEVGEREAWYKKAPLNIIYWKNSISSLNHKVEAPLKGGTQYYWSVRPSNKKSDDDWARYNFYFFSGFVNVWMTDSYFRFKTATLTPLAINNP